MASKTEAGYTFIMSQQPTDEQMATVSSEKSASRVWRACLECRLKKRKCDGKDTCQPCQSRNRVCEYPESNDNASTSRQLSAKLEARCQQMEALCDQMKTLMGQFATAVENLDSNSSRRNPTNNFNMPHMPLIGSTPLPPRDLPSPEQLSTAGSYPASGIDVGMNINSMQLEQGNLSQRQEQRPTNAIEVEDDDEEDDPDEQLPETEDKNTMDHIMTIDSYGKLRFVGGTSTMVLVDALRSLNASEAGSPMETRPSPGDKNVDKNLSVIELPFFSRGKTWPRLPHLPQASQLPRPPRYVSDLLVNIYFEQLHYTFPVLYKPHFMQRYNLLMNARQWDNVDIGFLSVFFAVCACGSGLLPREPGIPSSFTGLKFYESALLLHYASTGEGTIEQVQCLALLSMCSAGWNTLAQSWKFAGQAVRAAQDLGLHRSPDRGAGDFLKEELCRRIWWSIYGLDRVLSACLGRPMAIDDADCDSELPHDIEDSELEAFCKSSPETRDFISRNKTSMLTGFIAFSKLCQISGKILRSMSSLKMKRMRDKHGPKKAKAKLRVTVRNLDEELEGWLRNLPDSVKFSANDPHTHATNLTMCVIVYMLQAACIINLYRPLIRNTPDGTRVILDQSSPQRCLDAARGCIQAAELIKERIPPSHHLAFCAHYLALSGIILIRLSDSETPEVTKDVNSCIRYLSNLEHVFNGAKRGRLIIEELIQNSRNLQSQRKRTYSEIGSDEVDFGNYLLNNEIFADFSYPYFEGIGNQNYPEGH